MIRLAVAVVTLYFALALVIAGVTGISLSASHKADESIARCADNIAVYGGEQSPPSLVWYSLFKGFFWPVALNEDVIKQGHSLGDWFLASYDPFTDKCRQF